MSILFTPRTPRPLFILLLTVGMMSLLNIGIGQNVNLRPLSDYETSLQAYHTARVQVLCSEFTARTKTKWWYYLPSIGFQFGLPSISAGTNQLVGIDQTRQQNRVKWASIMSQGLLDYRTDLHQLRSMYTVVQISRNADTEQETSWHTIEKLFGIKQEANKKKEISPEEYYTALLGYQREFSASQARHNAFVLQVVELARFARYEFPDVTLPGLDSLYTTRTQVRKERKRPNPPVTRPDDAKL